MGLDAFGISSTLHPRTDPFDGFDVYAISTAERHNQLILEPADDSHIRLRLCAGQTLKQWRPGSQSCLIPGGIIETSLSFTILVSVKPRKSLIHRLKFQL